LQPNYTTHESTSTYTVIQTSVILIMGAGLLDHWNQDNDKLLPPTPPPPKQKKKKKASGKKGDRSSQFIFSLNVYQSRE
jgi:hypothetical protein